MLTPNNFCEAAYFAIEQAGRLIKDAAALSKLGSIGDHSRLERVLLGGNPESRDVNGFNAYSEIVYLTFPILL